MKKAALAIATILAVWAPARGQQTQPAMAEIVQRGKAATALLESSDRKFGTAFCVDSTGLFLTNNHLLPAGDNQEVFLVLRPNESDEKKIRAVPVRRDSEADLALLKVKDAGEGYACLELVSPNALVETAQVIALGYPFGTAVALDKATYPSITVSTGRVISMRKKKGKLEGIQLDCVLNPGNSGGPVLDSQGKVVGVAVSGILGLGLNFAIPSDRAEEFLRSPVVAFDPPKVTRSLPRVGAAVPAPQGRRRGAGDGYVPPREDRRPDAGPGDRRRGQEGETQRGEAHRTGQSESGRAAIPPDPGGGVDRPG